MKEMKRKWDNGERERDKETRIWEMARETKNEIKRGRYKGRKLKIHEERLREKEREIL